MRDLGRNNRRRLSAERLEIRRCLAASLGWDGPGQGSADLSYYVGAAPAGLSQAAVESAIETALQVWSDVVDVDFTQTSQPNQRDSIDLSFGSIDGSGRTLAQAYLPDDVNPARVAGDVEFDIAERWEVGNSLGNRAFDLVHVAVHEIGHALGIDHLNVSGAVMAPYVSPSQQFTRLSAADVDAALELYAPAPSDTPAAQAIEPDNSEDTAGLDPNSDIPDTDDTDNDLADESDDTADTDTPFTNRNWRAWRWFWRWRGGWSTFRSRLVAAPASHNPIQPADVNQDGDVTASDALSVINRLLHPDDGESTMLADTNADGSVTAGDALLVINEVSRGNPDLAPTATSMDQGDSSVAETSDPLDEEVLVDDGALETDGEETGEDIGSDPDEPDDTDATDNLPNDSDNDNSGDDSSVDDGSEDDPEDRNEIDQGASDEDDTNGNTDEDETDEEYCSGRRHGDGVVWAISRLFTTLDTNGDDVLTADELTESLIEALSPIDADNDGSITLEEIEAFVPSRSTSRFDFLDDNGDGMITVDEVNESIWQRLVGTDANDDQAISPEEFSSREKPTRRGRGPRFFRTGLEFRSSLLR